MEQSVSSKRSRKGPTLGGNLEELAREITRLPALDVPALRQRWAALRRRSSAQPGARVWFDQLASGQVRSLAEVARNEGIAKRYVERLSRLAFVAPAIVEAICQGQQPAEISTETLLNRIDLPLEWPAQRAALDIGSPGIRRSFSPNLQN